MLKKLRFGDTALGTKSHMIESGQVFLPKNAPWLAEFQSEILAFPQSRHDDQVDSFSQYLNWKKESPMPRIRLL